MECGVMSLPRLGLQDAFVDRKVIRRNATKDNLFESRVVTKRVAHAGNRCAVS
jgi:hypothetical protein